MRYKPPDTPEKAFEKDLARIAPLFHCQYIKIKDTRSINKDNRGSKYERATHREVKRICDAIIITKKANWFCECKMESGKLLKHQEALRIKAFEYNGLFVVLRKQKRKDGWTYRVITKWGIWKTTQIEDIFKLLSEI